MEYINSRTLLTWRYTGTIQNPAYIGSKTSKVENLPEEWWDGSRWSAYPEQRAKQNEIAPTK